MKKHLLLLVFAFSILQVQPAFSQVLVSDNPAATADPSAMLDIQSVSKGLLVPRMTLAQRTVISNPPTSMIIYQTNGTPGLYYNIGTPAVPNWQMITDATTPAGYWSPSGSDIYFDTGNVGIGTAAPGYALHVVGTARVTGALRFDNGAAAGWVLTSDAAGNASWAAPAPSGDTDWTISGTNQYSGVSGNVGIGTTTPGSKLHVVGAGRITGGLRLDAGANNGYVLTSDAGGTATWQDPNTLVANDNDWTVSGNDIYNSNTGNVGVNTTTPNANLDVYGSIWAYDSIYVDGRPGRLFINGQSTYEPTVRFGYEGTSQFKLYTDAPATNPYLSITTDAVEDVWGINQAGGVWHDYAGTSAAYALFSDAEFPTLYIDNYGITGAAACIQGVIRDVSSPFDATVIGGWNKGDGNGVYGEYDHDAPTYSNFGYLGTDNNGVYGHFKTGSTTEATYGALGSASSGAWGVHDDSDNQGNLGLANYGAQGSNGTSDFWGALGGSSWGVYARMTPDGSSQSLSPGDFAIKGVGVEIAAGNAGAGYGLGNQVGGMLGYNTQGTAYSAGVAGYTQANPANRASGVFGAFADANQWGALGYEASNNNHYGGYFSNAIGTGGGKASGEPSSSIGIGVYGDLFGAHVDGEVYGLYASGGDYAMYSDGDVYKTGADVHLQMDNSGQNNVMYTLVTPEMTIQTYGIGQLTNGKSNINFDDAFANVVSDSEPIIVTITPIGETKGVYLQQVDGKGFSVVENNDGKSSVQFSWIAIGKRAGYENKSLPQDVVASDYNTKIRTGLHNDADITTDGDGLYYQNGNLIVGTPPETKSNYTSNIDNADADRVERKPMQPIEEKNADKTADAKTNTPPKK